VTVLGASGDEGATGFKLNLTDLYTHRVNSWPSSDPLVTSVGGTQLHLDAQGNRTAPDNVWNDQALFDAPAAGGGGRSTSSPGRRTRTASGMSCTASAAPPTSA
jgi:subtilase family serine protease